MKNIISVIGLIITFSFLSWLFFYNSQNQTSESLEVTKLEIMGDQCIGISEKAVIDMKPVVEFQKLEILSRKANVLKNCMADRGFVEDPAWRKYAKPLAQINASQQKISTDEAIETMRKADMLVFKKPVNRPLYWMPAKN